MSDDWLHGCAKTGHAPSEVPPFPVIVVPEGRVLCIDLPAKRP